MLSYSGAKPGVGTLITNQPRDIFWANRSRAQFIAAPATIDGTLSSNPTNAPYQFYLYAGTLLGRVTATRKYTNAVLGLTTTPQGGGQTTLNTDVNTAAELLRRVGATGTFTLTGPNVASGVVRSKTATYSAINTTTGAITITALATAAVSAVNQVNSLVTVDSTGSGTFTLTIEGITTAAITYNSTVATLITNINNALNATFGTSAIVASGASLAALILTFSGTGFSGRPVGTVQATLLTGATGFTMNGSGTVGTPSTSPVTTAGVTAVAADEGEFVTGSLIQPTDGSQTILTLICDIDGIKVADGTNVTRVDAFDPQLLAAGGTINVGLIVNYPPDPSLQAYVKAAIRAFCGGVTFSDDQI